MYVLLGCLRSLRKTSKLRPRCHRSCSRATTYRPIAHILESVRLVTRRASTRCKGDLRGKLDADSSESTEILPSPRSTHSQVAKEARPFSGRHDLLRFFGAPLATNRSRPANHSLNTTARMCCIRNLDGTLGPGAG